MNKWGFWLPPVHLMCPRCGYPKQAPSPGAVRTAPASRPGGKVNLSDEQRRELVAVVAGEICRDRPSYSPDQACLAHQMQADYAADALAPVVARWLAEAWDEAVRTMATAGLINSSVLAYGGAPPNPYRSES